MIKKFLGSSVRLSLTCSFEIRRAVEVLWQILGQKPGRPGVLCVVFTTNLPWARRVDVLMSTRSTSNEPYQYNTLPLTGQKLFLEDIFVLEKRGRFVT